MGNRKHAGKHTPWAQKENETQRLEEQSDAATVEQEGVTAPLGDSATKALSPGDLPQIDAEATAVMPSIPGGEANDGTVGAGYGASQATGVMSVPVIQPAASQTGFAEVPKKRKRTGLKAFLITFFVLVAILAGVYVGVANMFNTQFMPNTRIGDIDASMKHDDEVVQMLQAIPSQYKLDVVGDQFSMTATGDDIGMTIDAQAIVQAMHENQNVWYWPWYVISGSHDETALLKTSFDADACDKLVKKAVKKFNKTAQAPVSASIYLDEETNQFSIKPEEIGTQLAVKGVQAVVRDAAADMLDQARVTDEQLKQPKLTSTDKKIVDTVDMANGLLSTSLSLQINGNEVDKIDSEVLSDYVRVSDTFEVSLDEDGLAAWVAELAGSYDTVGMTRTYTRADGKVITVSGGTYGWEIDEATLRASIMDAIRAGGTQEIEIPCVDAANVYAGRGERDWGNRYIDVDISEQHVRFYGDDGKIIWEADCISGAPDGEHDTTQGVWYVVMKQSPSVLVGYLDKEGKVKDYEEQVKYWMPFVGNSIGFHDATWQPGFGGSMYAQGYGSHGCVNLSYSDAEKLYNLIEPNDVVVVHS